MMRRRARSCAGGSIDQVWIEEITVVNHLHETSHVHVALEVDTDFADLFEVKAGVVAERDDHVSSRRPSA